MCIKSLWDLTNVARLLLKCFFPSICSRVYFFHYNFIYSKRPCQFCRNVIRQKIMECRRIFLNHHSNSVNNYFPEKWNDIISRTRVFINKSPKEKSCKILTQKSWVPDVHCKVSLKKYACQENQYLVPEHFTIPLKSSSIYIMHL